MPDLGVLMIPTGALFQIHLRRGEVQEEGRLPGTEGECVCVCVCMFVCLCMCALPVLVGDGMELRALSLLG